MRTKYVILLSSGLDSTVNFYEAIHQGEVPLVLHFQYGQRASQKELSQVQKLTKKMNTKLQVIELPWFSTFQSSALLQKDSRIPGLGDVQIDDHQQSLKTAASVWIPNRNGVFLNIAAAFAENLHAEFIVPGFNLEEASTFPDNSKEFLDATDAALKLSTANHVKTKCFTTMLDKTQILGRALELGISIPDLWPCYHAFEKWCGECESCQRFQRALRAKNISLAGCFL